MKPVRGFLATAFCALVIAGCGRDETTSPHVPTASLAAHDEYVVIDLGTLGGSFSRPGEAGAINTSGQVVGVSTTATGETHAFLWNRGVMIDLGAPGEVSYADAINEKGQVIGSWYSDCTPSCARGGFVWERGVRTDLDMVPSAINDVGQIVGYSPGFPGHGYLWERDVTTDLGTLTLPFAINNAGQIVGSNGTGPLQALLWERGVVTELGTLGGPSSQARAINNRGQVVGNVRTATGEYHAFLWHMGAPTDLGTLGGAYSSVAPGDNVPGAINDQGLIVGYSHTTSGEGHAFLWDHGVMTDLGKPAGASSSVGWAVNNAGEVIGTYFDENGDDQVFVWAKGAWTKLPTLGEGGSWPAGINNAGQIAGSSGGHAVIWQRRGSRGLESLTAH